jgi:hypothetical protein
MADKMDLDDNISSETALRAAAKKKLSKSLDTPQELKEKTSEEIVHELQLHQIELEMQDGELKRVQLELEQSKEKHKEPPSSRGHLNLELNRLLKADGTEIGVFTIWTLIENQEE